MPVGPVLRIYGEIRGLTPESWAGLAPRCPLETADFDGVALSLEHEGHYVDVESFLDALAGALADGAAGHVDVIDNDAWTITRHVWVAGKWTAQTFGLDDVLENTKGEGNI